MEVAPNQSSNFWDRREGTVGMIVLAAAVVAGVMTFSVIASFVLSLLATMTGIVIFSGVLAFVGYAATEPSMRRLVGFSFKSAMRRLSSFIVNTYPIELMEESVGKLRKKITAMEHNRVNLRVQMMVMLGAIKENQRGMLTAKASAMRAQDAKKTSAYVVQARQADRLVKSTRSYREVYDKMKLLDRVLEKYLEVTGAKAEDMDNEIKVRKTDRARIAPAWGVFKSVSAAMKGDMTDLDLFDQASEVAANDCLAKVGEVGQIVDMAEQFVNTLDLQNGFVDDTALKQIEAWEAKADSLMLGDDKSSLLKLNLPDADLIDVDHEMARLGQSSRNNDDAFASLR